jgi:hypothetical protein
MVEVVWEANNYSAVQEISNTVWNLNVHLYIHMWKRTLIPNGEKCKMNGTFNINIMGQSSQQLNK